MKNILLLFLTICVISCDNKKEYYVDYVIKQTALNGAISFEIEKDTIEAVNDSLACISAYTSFYISKLNEGKNDQGNIILDKKISFSIKDELNNEIITSKYLTEDFKRKYNIELSRDIDEINKSLDTIKTNSIDSSDSDISAKAISEYFIKKKLVNPATADFSTFDVTEDVMGTEYTVLRKVKAKTSLGVEKEYIYKLQLKYLGGNQFDASSWKLLNIRSEEYK
ncbi:hypothetical protein [Flavobacterium denitrificans]|uniref:hypothetical protein n=1 Tax=Flavobacterium denitrificans TaxID=281361 RepID=UPI00040AFB1F|nr:hypothetical protein [Flavobacterium denitrificans]